MHGACDDPFGRSADLNFSWCLNKYVLKKYLDIFYANLIHQIRCSFHGNTECRMHCATYTNSIFPYDIFRGNNDWEQAPCAKTWFANAEASTLEKRDLGPRCIAGFQHFYSSIIAIVVSSTSVLIVTFNKCSAKCARIWTRSITQ